MCGEFTTCSIQQKVDEMDRRQMIGLATAGVASVCLSGETTADVRQQRSQLVATNTYPWSTFARRDGRSLQLHTPQLLADIALTGITGYEPIIESVDEFSGLRERLNQHGLSMKSLYVNSILHDPAQAEASITQVLEIARAAKSLGTKIIVTNPSPIRWGGDEDKSDEQLRFQASALDRLGELLAKDGLTLAYHNHDAELRQGGREFHHMLTATNADFVKLCLDAHWIYRGCGNSEVAVFDALAHYWKRVVELHLRQSVNGIWTEAFSMQGDINYTRLFDFLQERGRQPHLVLEQAVEAQSPQALSVIQAHRKSFENVSQAVNRG